MCEVLGISFDSKIDIVYRYPEEAEELASLLDNNISAGKLEGPYLDITAEDLGINFGILLTQAQVEGLIDQLTLGLAAAMAEVLENFD